MYFMTSLTSQFCFLMLYLMPDPQRSPGLRHWLQAKKFSGR